MDKMKQTKEIGTKCKKDIYQEAKELAIKSLKGIYIGYEGTGIFLGTNEEVKKALDVALNHIKKEIEDERRFTNEEIKELDELSKESKIEEKKAKKTIMKSKRLFGL